MQLFNLYFYISSKFRPHQFLEELFYLYPLLCFRQYNYHPIDAPTIAPAINTGGESNTPVAPYD